MGLFRSAVFLFWALGAFAQGRITTPREFFGFDIGDDHMLATYTQFEAYWKKIDQESDRMTLVDIGRTAEGRTQWMAVVTSPENHRQLKRFKDIARTLAHAEVPAEEARRLAAEGKAVIWIDGGLHATEVLGAHQLIETSFQFASRTDPETMRILRDAIILFVHANPDGMELVSNWYMREKEPSKRRNADLPRLYQKYVGHDNNRDFYMNAQPESENMSRQLFIEWFPQIMYNHHQTGPAGTVMFAPPFRDPANYTFDPMILTGLDLVGASMHHRFAAEGKPGVTTRKGASYSTWYNGGLRTTTYFHNMIGLLTETIGSPTPMEIPFRPERLLPNSDNMNPIQPQKWHFRQSIEYSLTANRAILDLASRHREQFLLNIYQMGRNSIERGRRDHWTMYPKRIEAVQKAAARDRAGNQPAPSFLGNDRGRGNTPSKYYDMLREPAQRDPRGYIITLDQPDFPTAVKFIQALQKSGITVHRATAGFTAAGKSYPAGSFVLKMDQAFRAHILDLMEPQDHPNDFQSPGGPPIPPYDNAGWTLAYQMGVKFDRILDAFDGPFERVAGMVQVPAGAVSKLNGAAGYTFTHTANDSFVAVNRLIKSGHDVYWLKDGGGTMFVPARPDTAGILEKVAAGKGVSFQAVARQPAGEALKLKPVRVGLWDRYGGSMPSGWLRFILERFEFPFEVVYPKTLDEADLESRFDVLIFADGAIGTGRGRAQEEPAESGIPEEFRGMLGRVTASKTVPRLKSFLENGGTILTIGNSVNLAYQLGLPVKNALMERTSSGAERALGQEKYYIPGSVLEASFDTAHPLAWGMAAKGDVFFDNSPVLRLLPEAQVAGVRPVAWFAGPAPLRSGWAWGQHYLEGGVAVAEAPVGKGKLFLYGPEVTFRSQPHGTFKLLFNGIYYGPAQSVKMQDK